MEDSASRSSLESASTTDEYVVVTPSEDKDANNIRHGSNDSSEGLNVPGNMAELKSNMEDAFREGIDPDSMSTNSEDAMSTPTRTPRHQLDLVKEMDGMLLTPRSNSIPRVHDTLQPRHATARSMSAPAVAPHIDECTLFNGVTYLGSTVVDAPCSEAEASNVMTLLKEQLHTSLAVVLSIPTSCEGMVRLLETDSHTEIASYRVQKILFCARGDENSSERDCFSFTNGHGDGDLYQCHVFKCENFEAVAKILYCFAAAFRRVQRIPSYQNTQINPSEEDSLFLFDVTLEIKEEDSKGVFNTVPRDKVCFKVRQDFSKRVIVTVTQVLNTELAIERCFGLLISPGRNVKYADMNLLDTVSVGYKNANNKSYEINGLWDPKDPVFEVLNSETPKATRVFVTVAVDLVVMGIEEPVRFVIETKMRIFPSSERFWYYSKKPFREQFLLRLREMSVDNDDEDEKRYEVISLESSTQIERKKAMEAAMLAPPRSATVHSLNSPADESEDNDEPLLSGSGDVTKDCAEDILVSWGDVLAKWRQNLSSRPKQLIVMIRKGIPEALRGEVWQLLAGCVDKEMMDHYRLLITRESPAEQVILRDINRTFPAHEFFRESGGMGQDSLYKISKAYSVYDEEVGYCQGLSFLAASLLLHMPEEQAFCVLVAIMFQYGLRDLFRNNFAALHLKFYQLERLIEEHIPDLFTHFHSINLEAHMFASQWFLTLFTAKFPLLVVFQIIDLVLCEGIQMIFNIAIALLKESHKDLLSLDFESTLKYFRVSLPKRYRSEFTLQDLIHTAVNTKISAKKIKKLEKEYEMMKEQEAEQEDPVERLERDNQKMYEGNLRLEQENDDLAHELVTSKIALRRDLDQAEDKVETLSKELEKLHKRLADSEEEKKRLTEESQQLKDMCRRELDRAETESQRNATIISEYRQIRSQLSERLEQQQEKGKEHVRNIMCIVNECENCCQHLTEDGQLREHSEERIVNENVDNNSGLMEAQMRELELELAQTKLKLVESECGVQDLEHKLHSTTNELQNMRSHWLHKTITSFKEVTTKKDT